VLEATEAGEIVCEYHKMVTEKTNGRVMNGQWFPSGISAAFQNAASGSDGQRCLTLSNWYIVSANVSETAYW
jgi:hypothetical protein